MPDAASREDIQPVRSGPFGATTLKVVDEVDGYTSSVKGVEIEAIRTGRGFGPNIVLATHGEGFIATSLQMGFPMYNRTTIGEGRVIAAVITSAPAGSRWCEIDLEPGIVLIYGPGAEHTAINPAGLSFSFAVADHEDLARIAEEMGLTFEPPPRGEVHSLLPTERSRALGYKLTGLVEAAAAGADPDQNREDDILHAMAAGLSEGDRGARVGSREKIDNRHVANICIEYAEAVGRIPTIRELCLVAHVSERRLRVAFTETYDMPPARFFRIWGLDHARRQLVATESDPMTVTDVAMNLGFAHLGRFSGQYRALFGETPSDTLLSHSAHS